MLSRGKRVPEGDGLRSWSVLADHANSLARARHGNDTSNTSTEYSHSEQEVFADSVDNEGDNLAVVVFRVSLSRVENAAWRCRGYRVEVHVGFKI